LFKIALTNLFNFSIIIHKFIETIRLGLAPVAQKPKSEKVRFWAQQKGKAKIMKKSLVASVVIVIVVYLTCRFALTADMGFSAEQQNIGCVLFCLLGLGAILASFVFERKNEEFKKLQAKEKAYRISAMKSAMYEIFPGLPFENAVVINNARIALLRVGFRFSFRHNEAGNIMPPEFWEVNDPYFLSGSFSVVMHILEKDDYFVNFLRFSEEITNGLETLERERGAKFAFRVFGMAVLEDKKFAEAMFEYFKLEQKRRVDDYQ